MKTEEVIKYTLIKLQKAEAQRDKMLTFLKEVASALSDKSKLSIWEISVLKEAKEIIKEIE